MPPRADSSLNVSPNDTDMMHSGEMYLIVDRLQYFVITKVFIGIGLPLDVFGIVANAINIRTFWILRLKDGVTVTLFALAITDCLQVASHFILTVLSIPYLWEKQDKLWLPISLDVPIIFLGNSAFAMTFLSTTSITLLAVARCLCVASPLKFKDVFTTTRCVTIILSSSVVPVIGCAAIFSNMGVQTIFDATRNASQIVVWFSTERKLIKDLVHIILDNAVPFVVVGVLITCVIIMTYKLMEFAKFRNCYTHSSGETGKLTGQDRRVIQQVILISVIYIVTTLPKYFTAIYSVIESEFDVNKKYYYFYRFMYSLQFYFECINASSNIFVYYKYNSAYRAVCFRRKRLQCSKSSASL